MFFLGREDDFWLDSVWILLMVAEFFFWVMSDFRALAGIRKSAGRVGG